MADYNWNDLTPSQRKAIESIIGQSIPQDGTILTIIDFMFNPFITAPNGTKYYLKVANDGTLSTSTTKG